MDLLARANHILNFLAPALLMALLLPLASIWRARGARRLRGWGVEALLLFSVGTAVLAMGLWYFGTDGKMATYGALVVVTATLQWALARGWR